jgi:shikimate dehydrogenase
MRLFGLIGYPLSHSFSQKYFTEKFSRENLGDCSYLNFSIQGIEELKGILKSNPNLEGINVTIPHKENIIRFLDWKNPVVEQIQACNCIRIREGRLFGYNTDVLGFENSLMKKLNPRHDRALILGTGGAAKAVAYVLNKLGIPFQLVSRRKNLTASLMTYGELTTEKIREYPLIINTTPIGMYPNIDQCPDLPYEAIGKGHYLFDLIYNPGKTQFLQKGERGGAIVENGEEMLVLQAEESWKIWN